MKIRFALIGNPVAHSLSPIMHNVLYRQMGLAWTYEAICCPDEESAITEIGRVRTGHFQGMNVTMPYKRLALEQADYVDPAADAAGGANVLLRGGDFYDLYAYNTDGLGAVGAIARVGGMDPRGKRVVVCGTGPTSAAIVYALANSPAAEIVVLSRDRIKAERAIERVRMNLSSDGTKVLRAADYDKAATIVPKADILVDATPRGMSQGDTAIVDPRLFHEGQVVLDTVYAHGVTELVGGARKHGAVALDGLEMLVEQAALSVEIWAEHLGLDLKVSRDVMRTAAQGGSGAVQ